MLGRFANVTAKDIADNKKDDGLYQIQPLGNGKHFQIADKFGGNTDFISYYLCHCIGFQWKNPFCKMSIK